MKKYSSRSSRRRKSMRGGGFYPGEQMPGGAKRKTMRGGYKR